MTNPQIVDLFAGPGGWDEGLRMCGVNDVLGIENDAAACATAELAGHGRLNADIAALAPHSVADDEVEGLIASPPCPGFSAAGKGLGRKDFELLLDAINMIALGYNPNHVLDDVRSRQHDERSALTLEPLRWALDLEPEWIALEQVPQVLPLWRAYATVLEQDGYSVATGYVHAEQYGVSQTRKRAVLVATRSGVAMLPEPTHSKYHSRTPSRLDLGVEKWVSMAEALGIEAEGYLRSNYNHGGQLATPGERDLTTPAFTVTSKFDRNHWIFRRPSPTIVGSRRSRGGMLVGRQLPPGESRAVGGHGWDGSSTSNNSKAATGVRVTAEQASVLQSFRADYPWQGLNGQRFQQIGNAVPPLLAAHILAPLTGSTLPT